MPFLTLQDYNSNAAARKQESSLPTSFDFIVVGAGSAGCALASRLSEDLSVTVLLVEAGPAAHSLETECNVAIPAAVGKLQHVPSIDWGYYTVPQATICQGLHKHKRKGGAPTAASQQRCSYWPRGKGVGGSSLINYMAWVRGHPHDYDEWVSKFGALGWSWKDTIEPLFRNRIEDTTECCGDDDHLCSKCHSTKGVYGISHKRPVNSLVSHFLEACAQVGFDVGDYNCACPRHEEEETSSSRKRPCGIVGIHQQTVRRGTRCTAARAYIDPLLQSGASKKKAATAERRPNLFVLTQAKCKRVLLSSEVATGDAPQGVVATGVELIPDDASSTPFKMVFHCQKEVILSAGALGSPHVLLQSGIGPELKHELPQVGRNLYDHLAIFMRFSPKLGQGNQDIGAINSYRAEGLPFVFKNLYEMIFKGKGVLTSSAYDASLFYHTESTENSDKGLPSSLFSNGQPNLQISCVCSPTDERTLQTNIGLDLTDFELSHKEMWSDAQGMVAGVILLQPKSKGYLKLREDANNELDIYANYLDDKDDLRVLMSGLRMTLRIVNTGPFCDVISKAPVWPKDLCRKYNLSMDPNGVEPDDYPDAFLEEYIRRYATTLYHPTSTCRMGWSSTEAVVDNRLKVFGINGLRIADASIQPYIVSANTQASCVVIGERAANIIREDYSLQSNHQDLVNAVREYEESLEKKQQRLFVYGCLVLGGVTATVVACAAFCLRRALATGSKG